MSISTHAEKCQEEITDLRNAFEHLLNTIDSKPTGFLELTVQNPHIPLLLALLRTNKAHYIYVSEASPKKNLELLNMISAWQKLWNVDKNWHLYLDQLSEQEWSGEITTDLSRTMHTLLHTLSFPQLTSQHFIVPAHLMSSKIPDPAAYKSSFISLTVGERLSMKSVIEKLVSAGYKRHQKTIEPGSFIVKGEQIEIQHPLLSTIYRIIFLGSVIEKITIIKHLRSNDTKSFSLPPVAFPTKKIILSETLSATTLIGKTHLLPKDANAIQLDAFESALPFPITTLTPSAMPVAIDTTVIFYENIDRVQAWAREHVVKNPLFMRHPLSHKPVSIQYQQTAFISEEALFPTVKQNTSPISYERAMELLSSLQEGKPAVHTDHGIGIYEGLQIRSLNGIEHEYLIIRYAKGDVLSVPIEYAHKLTPYVGESAPIIHRLGGTLWTKTKKKAQHDAAAFAKELLAISKKRADKKRNPYVLSQEINNELEEHFDFALTPDQKRTWEEIEQDMEQDTPMDRLLVGDVGFGKTEIAIRAAYHAVKNGKQVAILAPTTLLAQQHLDTFRRRLPNIVSQIDSLSRFISPKKQKEVRESIKKGEINICIGTHALLSKSTVWKNLGLVIIDEEQRFGVKQKEHFKKIRTEIDVLSLSATPIPRTLSMALSGLRQLSLISTPPKGRKNVKTNVARVSDELLTKALAFELSRGGQAYVVAPKIRHLHMIQEHIRALLPQAKTAIIHGQLPDQALSDIVHKFDQQELDILICSSIVENGLDLPNANTMIVWHAPHFGLADLYQLRGRIGRRDIQGHAYFLYDQEQLTPIQKQRLTALTEASRLGSGWLIAQRDLEIRGTGNILGAEQSGSANAVGVQLYLDMVNEAIDEDATHRETDIQLPIPALIPIHYIADVKERTKWYQRLTRTRTSEQLSEVRIQLKKNYGEIPLETNNLLLLLELQHKAERAGITKITSSVISPSDEDPYARLIIEGKQLPEILRRVGVLGNWQVRGNALTWDIDAISSNLVKQLADCL